MVSTTSRTVATQKGIAGDGLEAAKKKHRIQKYLRVSEKYIKRSAAISPEVLWVPLCGLVKEYDKKDITMAFLKVGEVLYWIRLIKY